MSKPVHIVTMENAKADFRYVLGVFSTGRKAEIAAQYEIQRRRTMKMPGEVSPKITRIQVDEIHAKLDVDTLDDLLLNRV